MKNLYNFGALLTVDTEQMVIAKNLRTTAIEDFS
jgi:hypothetical protein